MLFGLKLPLRALRPTLALRSRLSPSVLSYMSHKIPTNVHANTYNRPFSSKSPKSHRPVEPSETTSAKDRYIAVFTCNICNHRSAKSFSKQAYNNGVVYVRCESCKTLHLISDQLGWFGEKQNIEEILAQKGQEVSKMELGVDVSDSDLELIESLKDNKHFKE